MYVLGAETDCATAFQLLMTATCHSILLFILSLFATASTCLTIHTPFKGIYVHALTASASFACISWPQNLSFTSNSTVCFHMPLLCWYGQGMQFSPALV